MRTPLPVKILSNFGFLGYHRDIYEVTEPLNMPDPDALWKDIQKLDDMYEELLWHPDDELQFSHDGEKIIITNKTLEEKKNE